jgi:hypothetical protein
MIKIDLKNYHYLEIIPGDYKLDFELKESIIENGNDSYRVRIKGFLKWDGCMNWRHSDDYMYHFCDEDDANLINECFLKLWEIGPEYIVHWLF